MIRGPTAGPIALGLALAGCTALFTYPEAVDETSGAVCGDGIDNDLDGQIDCLDIGCSNTEACTLSEQSFEECSDRRDNDEDGFIDRADPLCWHLYDEPWLRCRRTRSATVSEQFDVSLGGRWYGSEGGTPILGEPPVRVGRSDLAVELRMGQRIFPRATVNSPRGELRIGASVVVSEGSVLHLEVWPAATSGPDGQDISRGPLGSVSLGRPTRDAPNPNTLQVVLERGGQQTVERIPAPESGWFDVAVDVSCGTAISVRIGDRVVRDRTAGTCYVRTTSPEYRPPGPMAQTEVRLGIFSTGTAWVDDVLFESLGSEACGARFPRIDADPGARPLPTDARILSISNGLYDCDEPRRPMLCALVLDRDGRYVEPWRSQGVAPGGTGPRLGMQLIRGAPVPATGQVQSASVEWTWPEQPCEERRWRATLRTVAPPAAPRLQVFESVDCQTWEPVEYTIGQIDDTQGWAWHGYFIRSAQQDERIGPRQELFAAQRGEIGLYFGRAFEQGNGLWTEVRDLNDRNVAQLASLDFPISLSRVGNTDQLLFANVPDQGLRVHVIPPGTLGEVLGWQSGLGAFDYTAQFDPSGRPGTTDRWDIESAVATVAREDDGNPFGYALYAARGDYDGPPDSEAVSFEVACRQVSLFDTPCELPDPSVRRDLEPRCNDGFCFDGETCETCRSDCGGFECAGGLDDDDEDGEPDISGPLDLAGAVVDEPQLAHANARGDFVWTRPFDGARASLALDPSAPRNNLHFDLLLDGDDGCTVRVGLGDDAVTPDGDAVGELVQITVAGDRLEYVALTRNAAGVEVVSEPREDEGFAANRARWQHISLLRNADAPMELAVRTRELDIRENPQVRANVPRVVTSRTRLFVEIDPFEDECTGTLRNVFVD